MEQLSIQKEVPQFPEVELLNEEQRIFRCWGSVEVRDLEGDLIPMSEFKKIMPVIIKRGGVIMDSHSNRQIGKILNYEFKEKEGVGNGVLLTCEIFKDYELDNERWDGIKKNQFQGLSFGGRNKTIEVKFEQGEMTKVLKELEGYEFSLVERTGNQEAEMESINYFAKAKPEELDKITKDIEIAKNILKSVEEKITCSKPNTKKDVDKVQSEKYIKNVDSRNSMETKKEAEETPQETETSEQAPVESSESTESEPTVEKEDKEEEKKPKDEEVEKSDSIEKRLSSLESGLSEIKELLKTKKEEEKPKEEDEEVEKSDEEKTNEETEEVEKESNIVEKVKNEVLKSLNVEKAASTPRPEMNDGEHITKSKKEGVDLNSWDKAHQLSRKIAGKK